MPIRRFKIIILFGALLSLSTSSLARTILIPTSGGSMPPLEKSFPPDKTVTVITHDNKKHVLTNFKIEGLDYQGLQLARVYPPEQMREYLLFMLGDLNYADLRDEAKDYEKYPHNYIYVPIMLIATIRTVEPSNEQYHLELTFRDPALPPLKVYPHPNDCPFSIRGKENLGEFGTSEFYADTLPSRAGYQKIILYTPQEKLDKRYLSKIKLKGKTSQRLTLTEKCGIVHEWQKTTFPDQPISFSFGENGRVDIDPKNIKEIEFIKNPDLQWQGVICNVQLRSGAKREFVWEKFELAGEGPQWFESILNTMVKKIEFH